MEKEVKIIIETTQIVEGESHTMKYVQDGQHYLKNGQHYIFYEEAVEGTHETIKNRLTFNEAFMQVSKKGPLTSEMHFETGKEWETQYQTPFGTMRMQVKTHAYEMQKPKEEEFLLIVKYDLGADSGQIAKCHMKIKINQ